MEPTSAGQAPGRSSGKGPPAQAGAVGAQDSGARSASFPACKRHQGKHIDSVLAWCWPVRLHPRGFCVEWLSAHSCCYCLLLQVETPKHPVGVVRSPLQPEEVRGLTRGGELGQQLFRVANVCKTTIAAENGAGSRLEELL